MEETKANAKKERERESRKRRTRKGEGDEAEAKGAERGERKREAIHGCWDLRERASQGRKKGENKLKAKLYSHKKMELFLDAVPPRYEEKEG